MDDRHGVNLAGFLDFRRTLKFLISFLTQAAEPKETYILETFEQATG